MSKIYFQSEASNDLQPFFISFNPVVLNLFMFKSNVQWFLKNLVPVKSCLLSSVLVIDKDELLGIFHKWHHTDFCSFSLKVLVLSSLYFQRDYVINGRFFITNLRKWRHENFIPLSPPLEWPYFTPTGMTSFVDGPNCRLYTILIKTTLNSLMLDR